MREQTQEDLERIQAHMAEKIGTVECPLCGCDGWDISATLRGLHLGENKFASPLVPLCCRNCHHVLLFLAKPLGMV